MHNFHIPKFPRCKCDWKSSNKSTEIIEMDIWTHVVYNWFGRHCESCAFYSVGSQPLPDGGMAGLSWRPFGQTNQIHTTHNSRIYISTLSTTKLKAKLCWHINAFESQWGWEGGSAKSVNVNVSALTPLHAPLVDWGRVFGSFCKWQLWSTLLVCVRIVDVH